MPIPIMPMLLHSTDSPPAGEDWIHQVKWDGLRCLFVVNEQGFHIWSRHNRELTAEFPEFKSLVFEHPLILDGELVVIHNGTVSMARVRKRAFTSNQSTMKLLSKSLPAHYMAFDILRLNDEDIYRRPLTERFSLLRETVPSSELLTVTDTFDDGATLFASTKELGWEGVVSKRKDSVYQPGKRSWDWLKARHTWKHT